MAKKTATLASPSVKSIELVLQAAEAAPRQNGPTSRQLDAAVMELDRFFQQLLGVQNPQASASAGGKSSDQG